MFFKDYSDSEELYRKLGRILLRDTVLVFKVVSLLLIIACSFLFPAEVGAYLRYTQFFQFLLKFNFAGIDFGSIPRAFFQGARDSPFYSSSKNKLSYQLSSYNQYRSYSGKLSMAEHNSYMLSENGLVLLVYLISFSIN